MTAGDFTARPGSELFPLIQDLEFPTTTRQIVKAARTAGASPAAIETFERLPERIWPHAREAIAAATSGWDVAEEP